MINRSKKKYQPGIDPERRVGLPDRRQTDQKPIEVRPGRGWSGGKDLRYRRTDSDIGEVTFARDGRIRPKGRRKGDK